MNKRIKALIMTVALTAFTVACRGQSLQAQADEQTVSKTPDYQVVLGKAQSDQQARAFFERNNCSNVGQFELCYESGLAFWIDFDQIVEKVYLYAGNANGFKRYRGQLPFGLSFYDPMWRVEEKLQNLNDDTSLATSTNGLPDEGISPDHIHYWAVYKQLGMTVIYDEPFPDEDAYIYAILIRK